MTTGFILVFAVLILGGVIATAGDRIGMRVGKARLTLFNLRPRQTATLITILTGSVISATTLGLLFAVSEQLRTGVFELREIQDDLERAREELNQTQNQKRRIEDELAESRKEQREARQQLRSINQALQRALNRQRRSESELERVESNFRQAQARLRETTQQSAGLRADIEQLREERRELLAQRDRDIAERDRAIAARESEITEKEEQLQALENQRSRLVQELLALDREIQALREGDVVIFNKQVLAAGVVRIVEPEGARQAVDQLLQQANRNVLDTILPGTQSVQSQVVQIPSVEVEQLITRLQDGQDYVVRILSGGNYLVGEPCVLARQPCIQVVAEAVPNQLVFTEEEVIAATTVPPSANSQEQIAESLELLIAATQFRAKQAGIISDSVRIANAQDQTIVDFFERLIDYQQANRDELSIQAIAANDIYTVGPLALDLVVTQNGEMLFSTIEENPE